MAEIYKRVKGQPIEKFIGKVRPVQAELSERAFEIGVRAEQRLIDHRQDGHAYIEVDTFGNVDWYVWLNDENGDEAAMSIEFGRAGYIDVETKEVFGAMEGLFILTDAAHLSRKRGRRLPKERVRVKRPRRQG